MGASVGTTTESKAQRAERLKRALNPWEAYGEIVRFAREGHGVIPPEWGTYFRWWGIYSQGDGAGVTGGTGGEGRATRYFMVRVRLPGGAIAAHQLETLAALVDRHALGVADITVRQNVQLHWIAVEDLPPVMETLWRSGLSSLGACGDVGRNVTGCPLAGVAADEIIDATPLVQAANRLLAGNAEFYNLPRKFKTSIAGCREWCAYPEINDVGFTALTHPASGEIGFSVRVGGGLATDPHFGIRLDAFLRPHDVVPVLRAVTEIFRDAQVLRESREKARLKFLFLQHGWTGDRFLDELQSRLGYRLERAPAEAASPDVYRDHVGIHPQKQAGLCYAGVPVPLGRLSGARLRAIATAASQHGSGEVRFTTMQNAVLLGVRRERIDVLTRDLEEAGLPLGASPLRRGTIACTGSEFCKLALTETKGFARRLVEELERRLPGFDEHVRLHVTGCPNSCGQHWIADIGLEGKKVKSGSALFDAYYFCVGGAVGARQAMARPIGLRLPAPDVAPAIERLLRAYLTRRRGPGERFRAFCARHTDAELRELLTGEATDPVARDAPRPGLLTTIDA